MTALAAVALSGCKKRDPLFCCTSQASCTAGGIDEPITPCTDPERPYCDDEGPGGLALFGDLGRTCIADPMGDPCDEESDCSSERPFCIDNLCAQCQDDSNCQAAAPVCIETTHLCAGCTEDDDCSGADGAPRCNTDDGTCVACVDSADCGEDAPACVESACVACAADEDCGADAPICLANQCIECAGSDDCSADAPICDTSTCRGCVAHAECASDVCDLDGGTCFDEANIIYVSPRGGAKGTCTRDAPCDSFDLAIDQVTGTRNVIKAAPGMYEGAIDINAITVTILADGAIVTPAAENQPVVAVSGGGDASIEGMTITGASGPGEPPGVSCTEANSTIRLLRSTVIRNNDGGGISISGCEFSLVNNVIALNGGVESAFGGVLISQANEGLREFAFNTVTGNAGRANVVAGVDCASIAEPITFSNNIVYQNLVAGTGTQVDDDDGCSWSYSDIGPETVAGTGNINADPLFVDPDKRDFHLQAKSPARDAANPGAALARDIDGDARPAGNRPDMGADEIVE